MSPVWGSGGKKEIPDIHIRSPGFFVILSIEIFSTNELWKN